MPNLTISPHWEEVLLFSMYDKPLFVNWGWLLPSRGGLLIQTWLYPKWVCVLQNIAIICNNMCWPVPKSPLSWSRQSSAWEAFLDSSKPWILELHEVKPLGGSWIFFLLLLDRCWLVVYLLLWKIWKSVGMIIPNISKNKKCSKPPISSRNIEKHSTEPPQ